MGNFIFQKIKIVTEINILEQNKRGSRDNLAQRNGYRVCVLGNEARRPLLVTYLVAYYI